MILKLFLLIVTSTMLGIGAGCPQDNSLTEDERNKLDPVLQRLLMGETVAGNSDLYDIRERPDGTIEFGVIVRADDPEALREKGFRIQSVFGEMATARLTREEIREMVRIDEVRHISLGERSYLQTHPDTPDAM